MRLEFNEYASALLTTLSGDIKFSIKYKIPWPACWVDCSGDHTHTIASWDGFNTTIDFFDLTQILNIGDNTPASGWCGHSTSKLFTGDFNADGAEDYLCHDTNDGKKWIDYQSGGTFTGTNWSRAANWCTGSSNQVLVGDFSGDGRDDMLCHGSSTKLIDYADSNAQFYGTDWSYSSTWCTSSGMVIYTGDYNSDGRDDLYCYNKTNDMKYLDYADASGHFAGTDWSGTVLPTGFCGMYNGDTIALKTYHNKYVRAGGSPEGWAVNQGSAIGNFEKFVVSCNGEVVSLKSYHNRYLQANDSSSDYIVKQQTYIGDWEKFTAVEQDDGTWAFLTDHDRYLQARGSGDNWVVKQQTFVGTWETFTVVPQ
jgi:hypothetical protein